MTSEDIRSQPFETVRKGYNPDVVDDYLMQVANAMEQVEADRDAAATDRDAYLAQRDAALAEKEDLQAKMYVLATKVEEYRGQEDTLKTALINAQRMGETVVHEAKQKADQIVREATGQSELLRQRAEDESRKEHKTLEKLQNEVKNFKTTILNLYKQHIESLSALDPPVQRVEELLEENRPASLEPVVEVMDPAAAVAEMDTSSLQVEVPAAEETPAGAFADEVLASEAAYETSAAPESGGFMFAAEEAAVDEMPVAPTPEEVPLTSLFEGELIED